MASPWTWACLACNATGVDRADAHRCSPSRPAYLYELWLARLQQVVSLGEAKLLLQEPIARTELVRLLGDRWSAEHTLPGEVTA